MPTRRKELKYTTVYFQDGFSGTGAISDSSIAALDTTLLLDSSAFALHDSVTIVPVGARFTTAGITTIRTVTAQNNSQVWTVTVDATAGNFTLTFEGQTTANIAFDAAASTVQTALEALSNVAAGELLVTGSAGGPFTITAAGTHANTSGLVLSATDVDLTGGGDTVTVATVEDGTATWEVTFTPAIATGSVPSDTDVVTFLPQQVEVKIGEGNVQWTENFEPIIDLDRGLLDGARSGDEQPMEVSLTFVFDWMRASSGGSITVYEAVHQIGGAAGWHSASSDPCEPYCIQIRIEDTPTCGSEQSEVMVFPRFYKTSINPNFDDALVSLTGQCVATRPTITREDL